MPAYSFPLFSGGPMTPATSTDIPAPRQKYAKAKLFNKQSEERLIEAVRKVAEYAESDGLHPTQAVIKAAQELNVPEPFVPLMVQSYNQGRAAVQRESCDCTDELCKLANFPIAVLEDAMTALYPAQQTETPSVQQQKTAVDAAYDRPPQFDAPALGMAKAASTTETPKTTRISHASQQQNAKRAMEEARQEARAAADRFDEAVDKVAAYFVRQRAQDRLELAEVDYNATRMFGKTAHLLLDHVRTCSGISDREKEAEARVSVKSARADCEAAPYSLIQQALTAGDEAVTKYAAWQTADKEVAAVKSAAGFLSGLVAGTAGGALTEIARKGLETQSPADMVRSRELNLMDPEHLNNLRVIRTQAMLTDLLHNDDVLSGHDPDEVLNAYNELAEMSPRVAMQPAATRAFLRKRMSGGAVEPFDLTMASDLEKGLKDTETAGKYHESDALIRNAQPVKSPALG